MTNPTKTAEILINVPSPLHLASLTAVDKDKKLIGAGDMGALARQSLRNLESALQSVGATAADVVKLNIYVKNYQHTEVVLVCEALRHYSRAGMPANT